MDPANTAAIGNLSRNREEAIHFRNAQNFIIVAHSPQALYGTY
jgi:hypothetical protein